MPQQKQLCLTHYLAAPIKLVGALDLGIELGAFFDIPPKVDGPI
jgi:hypothetical protein